MENYLKELKYQFEAGEQSFLIKLRCEFEWDRESFSHLISVMKICCEKHKNKEALERWLVEGFWYFSYFVRDHTMHPDFRKPYPMEYYEEAFQRLHDLASWFFTGRSPYLDGTGFEPM